MNTIIKTELKSVEVIPYDINWPTIFETEAKIIQKALGDNCIALHHVGSTSVPNLSAKPKIDIIGVANNLTFEASLLESINYTYRGGFSIPFRRSFTFRSLEKNINLHVFEKNDPEIALNILFRDYLITHPQAKAEYEKLKYELLLEESSHKKNNSMYNGYTLGKHDFITQILNQAGFNKHRFVLCTHYSEWDSAKNFRNTYIFGPKNTVDPYAKTLDHPNHKHLMYYKGTTIAGYAHIELLKNKIATLHMLIIDEKHRNNNYGEHFLRLCEKFIKNEGYSQLLGLEQCII